jgi:putative phosphoesterase
MMRIAAIYDIHGNLPALEAVLAQVAALSVDRIVVGGDVIPGPMPRETLTMLRTLPSPTDFILGNGEVAVLQQLAGEEPVAVPLPFRPIIEWTAQQLTPEDEKMLRSWPKTTRIELSPLGEILFCHATPRDENEMFTHASPRHRLQAIFEHTNAALVVCGHTHMQFEQRIDHLRIVNAGSVGMPFGEPGAYWVLLGPDVLFQQTHYNSKAAAERIQGTPYPQAQQFAESNVLHPPSEEQMLQVFRRAENN